ncbi:MAG: (2Fe-2S)-binding protein [Deltaproteobacteria bacterium]|nr:(2Fe-2S)-binding protein [Deltaproteobacteria bacterium]
MKRTISFVLNGEKIETEVEPHWTLLYLLRERFELTGAKEGCGMGECGACTVLVDGNAVTSCIFPVMEVDGKDVLTIEGLLGEGNELHPLQQSFLDNAGVQCGFCTPGMIMSAKALLAENPRPTEDEIRYAIAGNICRCTGYAQIVKSIKEASEAKSNKQEK